VPPWFLAGPFSSSPPGSCRIFFGRYGGKEYDASSRVGDRTCLVESKFLKVQQHRVRLGGGGASASDAGAAASAAVIPDWLWIDYHDRINVLVQAPEGDDTAGGEGESDSTARPRFLVFEQTKYALEDRTSLAVVGGIIEPGGGESAEDAARREVREELGAECSRYKFLGRYRTDVNRGMGWTFSYLASRCRRRRQQPAEGGTARGGAEVVGDADAERQDVKTLTLAELRDAVKAGRFLEIQWSATVALALLHLEGATDPP
jgi:ADP-ribose pyrophosphatase YjhB (NUDIX family)